MVKEELKLMTVFEVADQLGIHYNTVYRYIKNKKIHAVRIANKWFVSEEELRRILREGVTLD